MMEGKTVCPDFGTHHPVQGPACSPKRTRTESTNQKLKTNENHLKRRDNSQHPKSQQQAKLTKRRYSGSSIKQPTCGKRRRRAHSESDSVLPTNFLLGGNIFDPLNLNSLLDEEVNRALNAVTPKSSPLPSKNREPVEILIPRDITDPLNLNCGADCNLLAVPYKAGGKKRHRHKHHGASQASGMTQLNVADACNSGVSTISSFSQLPPNRDPSDNVQMFKETYNVSTASGKFPKNATESSSGFKEDETSVSIENPPPAIPSGAPYQHTSKRKRRRNSFKSESRSDPAEKSASEDKNFQTQRSGSKSGFRQNQQHNNQEKPNKEKFQYGNYSKYYGYRNPGSSEDPRTRVLLKDWFEGKDVLDLGCNTGHLTLYIAKNMRPARILGIDIDSSLIHIARKNIRHYLSEVQTTEFRRGAQQKEETTEQEKIGNESGTEKKPYEAKRKDENEKEGEGQSESAEAVNDKGETSSQSGNTEKVEQEVCRFLFGDQLLSLAFPVSPQVTRGPNAPPFLMEASKNQPGEFPSNVSFLRANYVLENDQLLLTQRPEYDVILCLSVTKWVHLNWGDRGLERFFKRIYKHLRPGGILIFEPQPWESYVRRKKLTDNINKNFRSIRLKPEQFPCYLTSEVGFTHFQCIEVPKCASKGFQRPIYVYHK